MIFDAKGHVLLAQRPAHKHLGLKWEFPGGKVENGEDPQDALRREIQEELGCALVIVASLPRFTHDYGAVCIEMMPFQCELAPDSPKPQAHEHVAVVWAPRDALKTYDLAPADWPVVASLPR